MSSNKTGYLLGHHEQEWARLNEQHTLWRDTLLPNLDLHSEMSVLEVGCGNGALLADLADAVGPSGCCVGLERDPAAVEQARERVLDRPWASVIEGDLMLAMPDGFFDCCVARWVLSFISDPATAISMLAQTLAPGGRLVIQDYNHDGVRLFPDCPPFNRVIAAFRAAYQATGGDLWIAGRLPGMMQTAGLSITTIDPVVRAGLPGSVHWRWVERFIFDHLNSITAPEPTPSQISSAERAALLNAWADAKANPDTVLFTPMVVRVVGERPH